MFYISRFIDIRVKKKITITSRDVLRFPEKWLCFTSEYKNSFIIHRFNTKTIFWRQSENN